MMLQEMTVPQFYRWMAFAQNNPIGQERADVREALNTTALINTMRFLWAKSPKAIDPKDMVPHWGEQAQRSTKEQMLAARAAWRAVFKARGLKNAG